MNPTALQKTTQRLARQGKSALAEAVVLRRELAALQAMTADAAYGALSASLGLRRGLYQRNQVGSERGEVTGELVEYRRPEQPLGKLREGPVLNWEMLFDRGLLG